MSEAAALERVRLDAEWKQALAGEFVAPYMHELRGFLEHEKKSGKTVYPPGQEIFNALNTTPLSRVKVVILGQDPYHGAGQAHGLCCSVRRGVMLPPSLQNIYKEIQNDLGIAPARHGDLSHWAEQGVLLLNSVLTVQAGQAVQFTCPGLPGKTFEGKVARVRLQAARVGAAVQYTVEVDVDSEATLLFVELRPVDSEPMPVDSDEMFDAVDVDRLLSAWFVALSWLPLIASVLVADTWPAATFVIWRSWPG